MMRLKLLILVAALTQAAAPAILFFDGFNTPSGRAPTPIVPANYAFSIWGLIYGLSLLFSILQFIPKYSSASLPRIGGASIGLFTLSTIWLLFARFGPAWATVPTIILMFVLATFVLRALGWPAERHRSLGQWCALAAFGVYAGWLTIAVFANFTEIAYDLHFSFFGLGLDVWSILCLAGGTVLACALVFRSRGNWFYCAAIIWALAAIAVANAADRRDAIAFLSSAGALGVAFVTLWTRRRARQDQSAQHVSNKHQNPPRPRVL